MDGISVRSIIHVERFPSDWVRFAAAVALEVRRRSFTVPAHIARAWQMAKQRMLIFILAEVAKAVQSNAMHRIFSVNISSVALCMKWMRMGSRRRRKMRCCVGESGANNCHTLCIMKINYCVKAFIAISLRFAAKISSFNINGSSQIVSAFSTEIHFYFDSFLFLYPI